MWLRAGSLQVHLTENVVEVFHSDAARWRDEISAIVPLADLVPQHAEAHRATLFLDR